MPSIKDLKKRITSVKNTQQTTRAMKMVSAAKLRRAQEAIVNQRPYAHRMRDMIQVAVGLGDSPACAPYLPRVLQEGVKPKLLLVLVTSDRGLCGAFNSNIVKAAQKWVQANGSLYQSISYSFVGRKAYDLYRARKVPMTQYYAELGGKVTFAKAKTLANSLVASFVDGEFDEIKVIYNEFKNAVSQKVWVEPFLPLAPLTSTAADPGAAPYMLRPDLTTLLSGLLAKNFSMQAFRILLESQAGEHGARMSAMENATKNSGEMIRKLTLQYNKQRQAGITKELLEIISGSESQKSQK